MSTLKRERILPIVIMLAIALVSGCARSIPADANIIDVNASLAQKSAVSLSQNGIAEFPIETWDIERLIKEYPSAVFVTAGGKIISDAGDSPYSAGQNEYYLGPLRMDACYRGASSVIQVETDSYVKGAGLSWWKSQQLKSEKVLPVPDVRLDEPIPADSSKTVSIYFLSYVFMDESTDQYAVLKDSSGAAEGVWGIIPQQ